MSYSVGDLFPVVDIKDRSRYNFIRYKGKEFAYDLRDNLLIYLFKDDEDIENMGKDKAPYRELDAVGLSLNNWRDKGTRNEYLDEYIAELEMETSAAAQDFIQNELPMLQRHGQLEDTDSELIPMDPETNTEGSTGDEPLMEESIKNPIWNKEYNSELDRTEYDYGDEDGLHCYIFSEDDDGDWGYTVYIKNGSKILYHTYFFATKIDTVKEWAENELQKYTKSNDIISEGSTSSEPLIEDLVTDPEEVTLFKSRVQSADDIDDIQDFIYSLSDGVAEMNAQEAFDANELNGIQTLKDAVITAIDVYLEDNEWLGEELDPNTDDSEEVVLDESKSIKEDANSVDPISKFINASSEEITISDVREATDIYFNAYKQLPKGMDALSPDYDEQKGAFYDKYYSFAKKCKELLKSGVFNATGYDTYDIFKIKCKNLCNRVDLTFPYGWKQFSRVKKGESKSITEDKKYQLRYKSGIAADMNYYPIISDNDEYVEFKNLMWTDRDEKIIRVDKTTNKAFYKKSGKEFGYLDDSSSKNLNETYWINNDEVMSEVDRLSSELEYNNWNYYGDKNTGSTYYKFYTRRVNNRAVAKAIVYSHTIEPTVIDITVDQLIGKEPLDSVDSLRRDLGNMLLPNMKN